MTLFLVMLSEPTIPRFTVRVWAKTKESARAQALLAHGEASLIQIIPVGQVPPVMA